MTISFVVFGIAQTAGSQLHMSNPEPDDLEYVTRVDVNMAIIREMAKLRFKERLPRIMESVARELMAAGVDFGKARMPETLTISNEEWDAIYEDLR